MIIIDRLKLLNKVRKGEFNHRRKIMPIKSHDLNGDPINPFKHQVAAFLVGITLDSCAFLMEQGTGKTLPLIAVLGHRYIKGQIKRAMIFCPVSVASELELQFKTFANYPYRLEVLVGNSKKRKKALSEWVDSDGLQIVIVNYEASWSRLKNGRNGNNPEITKWKPDIIACDESQKLKNGNSTQTKAICKIAKEGKVLYRLIMTGTPVSQGPLDFFGQYKFLDSTIFGTSFKKHKDEYAILGGYRGYQVVGFKNEDKLARKAHSISYRATKAECLDLPPVMEQTLSVNLEPEVRKIYDEFLKESIIYLENQVITAPLIITRDMKLAQIAGGYLKYQDDKGKTQIKQVSTAKMEATIDKIQSLVEAGSKVVVFARFTAEVLGLIEGIRKAKIPVSSLHGGVKVQDRKSIISTFQNPKSRVKVIVIQIATGGVGITLTAADTEIFYSRDFSNIVYEQAKARIDRVGQKKKVTIIHVVARNTVDVKVARALIKKQNVSKMLVDDYYKEIIGGRKEMRFKQTPMEYLCKSCRLLKLDMTDIELPKLANNQVVEEDATTDDLDSLLREMEAELGRAPMNKINLWDLNPESANTKPKRDKTPTQSKKVENRAKTDRPIVKLSGDVIPLKQLAEKMDADPKKIRQWLRKIGMETVSGKWEWSADDPQLEEIQKGFPG